MRFLVLLVTLLLPISLAQSTNDDRTRALGKEIRCPVCRGVPIGESPSEFARSMMAELQDQIKQGRTDDEIRQYFVTRYGQETLLNPPKSGANLIVWLGPLAVVMLGGLGLWSYLRRASQVKPVQVSASSLERVRLELEERKHQPETQKAADSR
jgi:cytochrome c-type biogenesis protein CcmH